MVHVVSGIPSDLAVTLHRSSQRSATFKQTLEDAQWALGLRH